MQRQHYFNYIELKLDFLTYQIEVRGKLNLLDLNIISESFFADLLNRVYGFNLENLNAENQNVDAIDLVDTKNKIVAQVTSQNSKEKIEHSLSRKFLDSYIGFKMIFVFIAKDASKLVGKAYRNQSKLQFNSNSDIYDVPSILRKILSLDAGKMEELYCFLHKELFFPDTVEKVDSNLTTVINILASEKLDDKADSPELKSFEIQRKIDFNGLNEVYQINEYKVFYSLLNEKYAEFDSQGLNTRSSVYHLLKKIYSNLIKVESNRPSVFYMIIDEVVSKVKESKNYKEMPFEELDLCSTIIVVDAFIRCKIFENPENYIYAATR